MTRARSDFKTSAADEAHKFQVRVYAVLWRLDGELNPAGRVVDRLLLAYDKDVDPLGQELLARRRAAKATLAARPPSAGPSAETSPPL